MKFYPVEWRGDPNLKLCSLAARGLWIEMCCLMHEADPYGHLIVGKNGVDVTDLASLVGRPFDQVQSALSELEDRNVFSRNRDGVIYSRRMTRDEKKAGLLRESGKRGGNPKLKAEYRKEGFVYVIGVRDDGAYKIGASVNPANRIKKIRAQYPGQELNVLAKFWTSEMGSLEAELHEQFAEKADGEWFSLTPQDFAVIKQIADPKGTDQGSNQEPTLFNFQGSPHDDPPPTNAEPGKKPRDQSLRETRAAQKMMDIWNEITHGVLPEAVKLTKDRRQKLLARARDSFENKGRQWRKYCERVMASPFLRGEEGRDSWHGATIDWVISPRNCTKILEGNYDDRVDVDKANGVGSNANPELNTPYGQALLAWNKDGKQGERPQRGDFENGEH